jgi:hypothetical protein
VPPASRSFDSIWPLAERIPGWLTRQQAQRLHAEAKRVAPGTVVEIGSHLGRSTVVLAAAGARVVAVDPFPDDWRYGLPDTEQQLRGNLDRCGVTELVDVRVSASRAARQVHTSEVRLLYVDGKHDYWSCTDDLRWAGFLRRGDRFLVHDAYSSVGVTAAVLRHALLTRRHRLVDRTGSLVCFEVEPPTVRDRLAALGPLPWFARNLVIKVLLRFRLRPVAALLGHRDAADPF